ncbi:MAG TPA: acyl-CoA dehydrogenase family protein [Actinomycetota bacterium]|nr:acyl-CoA dehydrogenase family protein [Actinomycetota bacterium]
MIVAMLADVDLDDSPAERHFRFELRAWLADHAPSRAHPVRGTSEYVAFARAWHRTLFEAGYAALSWPEEHGGRGAGPALQVIFEEELGRIGAPGLANHLGIHHVGPAIMTFGTDAQKLRYLEPMRSADEIWCQGFSEPDAGSDLANVQTRAVLDGDAFVVNGQKVWTTWGHFADWCQLLVRTEPDAPKHKGISCLLVDMQSPGITIRPLRQMSGEAEFNEIFLDEVRVPAQNLLGARGEGWAVAMATLASERSSVLTFHVKMKSLVSELGQLARAHGRDGDPLVRQALGRCAMDARALQVFSYWTVSNRGRTSGLEGSMAKLLWSELQQRIYETAADILGPDGIVDSRWLHGLLDARGLTIAAGTTEIQKNVLAERGLGMPRG